MIQRWLINVLLLMLVLLLGLLMQRDITHSRTPPTLSDLPASDLLQIEILREGEPSIQLGRSSQGWRLEAPVRMDADQERVDKLAAILDTPVHRSLPESSTALDQLGLTKPRIRLRLNTLELAFGGIDPVEHYRYVASEGLVHLIDDRVYPLLIAPPIEFISRRLLPQGFVPIFGRINGVALAAETLAELETIVAERIEPVTSDPVPDAGDERHAEIAVELKSAVGAVLRFLVSEDRRRWNLDLLHPGTDQETAEPGADMHPALRYVLTTAPTLTTDPNAIDPTPSMDVTATPADTMDAESSPRSLRVEHPTDPNAILPGDIPLGSPPEVRLTPKGQVSTAKKRGHKLHGEPDKAAPTGFGEDPFAPDPAAGD